MFSLSVVQDLHINNVPKKVSNVVHLTRYEPFKDTLWRRVTL